jgi:hypothetical protein
MRTAPVARGFFVGDYVGLNAVRRPFTTVFAVANSGNLLNRTDVFSTEFEPAARGASAARVKARASADVPLARIVRRADAINGPLTVR